ncbi:MAG: hypothetical protein ACI4JM_02345 [Oscillospiraceae bacterium]
MSISKKRKRKLTYNNKEYLWYVAEDWDSPLIHLHIIAVDKSLILYIPLNIESDNYYKRVFKSWLELFPFEIPKAITPKFVVKIIDWATANR